MSDLDSADVWVRFAAAAVARGESPNDAGDTADKMLDQFHRRWEWYSGGFGRFWKWRKQEDKGGKKKRG